MKKIEAIIRETKFPLLQEALTEAGINVYSYWSVFSTGETVQRKSYRGVVYDHPVSENVMLSLCVKKSQVDRVVGIILKNGTTNSPGDGRIFVSTIDDIYLLHNGKSGEEALHITE